MTNVTFIIKKNRATVVIVPLCPHLIFQIILHGYQERPLKFVDELKISKKRKRLIF